jgi:hypothetical protein
LWIVLSTSGILLGLSTAPFQQMFLVNSFPKRNYSNKLLSKGNITPLNPNRISRILSAIND